MLENEIPSHDTFNRVFQMIDPKKLHEAFQTWVNGSITKLEGVVAIDGKNIGRSREEISQTKLLKQEKNVKMGLKSKRKKCGWDKEYLYLVLSKLNEKESYFLRNQGIGVVCCTIAKRLYE